MNVIPILSAIAPKIFGIIDQAVSDKDLALKLKHEMSAQMLDNSSDLAKAGAGVIVAEAKGESWLQRNWRPLSMLSFLFLIGAYWFGFVPANMPEPVIGELFTLVQIGMGGYVVGRSGEKIASMVAPALGRK